MRAGLSKLTPIETDFLIRIDRSDFSPSEPLEAQSFKLLIQALRKIGVLTLKELHDAQAGEEGGIKNYKDFASRINELGYYSEQILLNIYLRAENRSCRKPALKKGNASTDPFYESFIGLTGIGDQTTASR